LPVTVFILPDQIPHSSLGREHQPTHGYAAHEFEGGLEHQLLQLVILGKKEMFWSSATSGGARRQMVVFPAPETPANRKARPLRTALAAWTSKPPSRANMSECSMRYTASIE
jgi:hypothetical protein